LSGCHQAPCLGIPRRSSGSPSIEAIRSQDRCDLASGYLGVYAQVYLSRRKVRSRDVGEEHSIKGIRVAILADNGFEQEELTRPKKALEDAGAETVVVSPQKVIRGWKAKEWGDELPVDVLLDEAKPGGFDALLLPGGVINADSLRMQPKAVEFVKSFFTERKPVAVICHGPWAIIEAGEVNGRRMTSWPSLKTDLRNAGADWVDQEVVVDGNVVSSRKPDDIPAFNTSMIDLFGRARARRLSGLW
jgi:protease I